MHKTQSLLNKTTLIFKKEWRVLQLKFLCQFIWYIKMRKSIRSVTAYRNIKICNSYLNGFVNLNRFSINIIVIFVLSVHTAWRNSGRSWYTQNHVFVKVTKQSDTKPSLKKYRLMREVVILLWWKDGQLLQKIIKPRERINNRGIWRLNAMALSWVS